MTVKVIPCCLVSAKFSEMLKILSRLIAPVYNTIGRIVTIKEIIIKTATKVRVVLSNLSSKY